MDNTKTPFLTDLEAYLNSSYPLLWVTTHEENRVVNEIVATFTVETPGFHKRRVYDWDAISGLSEHHSLTRRTEPDKQTTQLKVLLETVAKLCEQGHVLFLFRDFHPYLNDPAVRRSVRNLVGRLKANGSTILFISPVYNVPEELSKSVQTLEFALPDEEGLKKWLEFVHRNVLKSVSSDRHNQFAISPEIQLKAIEAARGMTGFEAENAYTLALVKTRAFSDEYVKTVFREKVSYVRNNSLLTYLDPDINFDQIGGLAGLKTWIRQRGAAYTPAAREYGLPFPRGMLLCGVPGCGS